jgi:hypothetical protein
MNSAVDKTTWNNSTWNFVTISGIQNFGNSFVRTDGSLWTRLFHFLHPMSCLHVYRHVFTACCLIKHRDNFTFNMTSFLLWFMQVCSPVRFINVISTAAMLISSSAFTERHSVYPCNRPWRPIGFWDVVAPTFCLDNRLTNGGEVRFTRRPPLDPGRFLVFIYVRGWVDSRATVRLERLGKLKNPVTSSGIERATIQLVAQCLNQLRYRVPPLSCKKVGNVRGIINWYSRQFLDFWWLGSRTDEAPGYLHLHHFLFR